MSARFQAEMDPISVRGRRVPTKQRIRWEWNIPLLIRSGLLLAILGIVATALYLWQSSRIASEILAQAKSAEERGESKEQVKWLRRYVRLVPNDVESLASFAFAIDSQPSTGFNEVEFARKRLSIALVACGDSSQFEELRRDLRRKLIPRLLQFGSGKALEESASSSD